MEGKKRVTGREEEEEEGRGSGVLENECSLRRGKEEVKATRESVVLRSGDEKARRMQEGQSFF